MSKIIVYEEDEEMALSAVSPECQECLTGSMVGMNYVEGGIPYGNPESLCYGCISS